MNRSHAFVAAATGLAVVLAAMTVGPPASASPGPRIVIRPGAGPPTARVRVYGRGFRPHERVALSFDTLRVATAVAAGDGSFSQGISIPRNAAPGSHEVEAEGSVSGRHAAAPFLVRTNWHQGEFDAAHTGHNRFENVLAPWNVGRLTLAWTAQVGVGALYASPIVVKGRVYLGSGDGRMHAFDTASGDDLWTGSQEQLFYVDSAASAYGLVYANSLYQRLRAYNAATGDVAWSAPVCSSVRASPTGAAHVLYMACFDGTLYALDPESGAMLWAAPGGCCVYDQAPVVDGDRVFQMRTDHTLTAYDASTGTTLWTESAFSVGTLAAAHGRLFYGSYPDVVAVDEATGGVLWSAPVFYGAVQGSPAVADGLVFVETSDLEALDARTGSVVWTAPASSGWGPSVANGVVYASSLSGKWDAYDERDGSLLWSVTVGGGCGGSCTNAIPVVADGTLYLAGPDQYLRAYRLGP